jgi:hypothetical protein
VLTLVSRSGSSSRQAPTRAVPREKEEAFALHLAATEAWPDQPGHAAAVERLRRTSGCWNWNRLEIGRAALAVCTPAATAKHAESPHAAQMTPRAIGFRAPQTVALGAGRGSDTTVPIRHSPSDMRARMLEAGDEIELNEQDGKRLVDTGVLELASKKRSRKKK